MLLPVIDWKEFLSNRGARAVIVGAAGIVMAAGAGALGYYLWPEPAPKPPPPIATSTLDQNIAYAASNDFNRLPLDQRLAWGEKQLAKTLEMDDDEFIRIWMSLDKETRDRMFRNADAVVRARVKKNVQEFHRLPLTDRKAYLDQRLDEMEKVDHKLRRASQAIRATSNPTTQSSISDTERVRKIRERENQDFKRETSRYFLNESGDHRARTASYFAALGRRQAERKLGDLFGMKRKNK